MPRLILLVFILLFSVLTGQGEDKAPPPSILSIIPAQAEPGTVITLSGTGFTDKTTVYIGSNELPAKFISSRQLSFELPRLQAGLYALFLHREDDVTSRTYNFSVMPVKPVAVSLNPDAVSFCSTGQERNITVNGRNFLEGSKLLFDGAAIKSRYLSQESISFQAPQVPGGLHQVQVQNPEDTVSGALGLMINSKPEVLSVNQGSDYVNYYELNIEGINFQQNSSLIVDGKRLQSSMSVPGERDRLVFVNCRKMIYQRVPYDPTAKSIQLQIVNQNGEESASILVSAP